LRRNNLNSSKSLNTLVEDIYTKIETLSKGKDIQISPELVDEFGESMKDALLHWATPRTQSKGLRMSNIGKPSRQLWYDMKNDNSSNTVDAPTQIKFLYGHLLEELLLFFVRLSGHSVADEQKEVVVNGIKGHMDCKIDGEVVDIKTASGFAFKKFSQGTLGEQDDFGYLSQLAGYEEAEGTDAGGFLVINKESGELCFYQPDDMDKPNIKNRIKEIKSSIKLATPPEKCYTPLPEGAKGNEKLPRPCTYCPHKFECHADANDGEGLRVFKYASGPVYLTKVVSKPRVEEL
jgi:hypothetical protein